MIALDAHMFSHYEYVPGTKALVLGPVPISIMDEHMCIEDNQ